MIKALLLSILALLLTPFAGAAVINVNSGMSEATIQGLINGGTSGDTVSFAPGTYNLASNGGNSDGAALNLKAGLIYTGPTSGSPAVLAGTGLYPMMYFSGTTVSILHLTFDNAFIFLEDHTTSATIDNNIIQNMPVCNTTASQTTGIFIAGGINNSDISFNTFSHIGDNCQAIGNDSQGAGGIVFFAFHNLTITNNTFDHVREGIDVPISTGGSYDCAGGHFNNNTFTNMVRMGIELLGSSSKPSGLEVAFNNFSQPLNPYFPSFGYSLTAGVNMIFHDNVSNSNGSTGTGPYGVEIAGISTQAYSNIVEGAWAAGFSIGNTSAISITNNNICGPNMNANPSSGSTPSVGNANGFISWQGSAGAGPNSFTGNTTSSASACGSTTVVAPVFSPVAGSYGGTQSVTATTSTSGASIVYTNNGTTPTVTSSTCTITNGTLYIGAINVATSQTLKAIGCKASATASSVTSAAYVITGSVTLTTTQPPYGWLLIPGAARTLIFYPSGTGATTRLVNYSVTGSATLSCTSNCLPEVTVTMPATGGTCSLSGSVGSYALTSTVRPILTATSVDNSGVSVTVPFNVCNTTVDAFLVAEPAYNQAYQGQKKTLQSYVVGYINQAVTWAITTAPSGGNATLSDTGNRDTIFNSGTVTGRYTLTATSVANGAISGTAIVYVSPNAMPAYSVTPNKTEPTECYVDPALSGTDYEVGLGQTYANLAALPLSSTWTAGSIVRIHPGTYANWMAIQGTGTDTEPIIICGIADGSGNLPIIDGFNATANPSTPTVLNGQGGFALTGTNSGFTQGYDLGSIGPDYVSITGLEIERFNYPYSYHSVPGGGLTPYGATGNSPSGIWIGSGQRIHMEGLDLEDDGWGVLANSNTGGVGVNNGRRFTALHQFIGGHINNFSQPGSFSNHGLYMEGIYSLVEGNLFENPQSNLSDPLNPIYDNGDFIKMRGGASIIRYNMFRGILTGPVVWYPDMEDTVAFVDIASQLGQPGVANCSLSTWCSYTSNNITLTELAENQETLAKDYFYGNVVSNEAGNQAIALLTYGSYSALQECNDIGYWCTPGIDRSGQLYAWSNTFDQPSTWTAQDSGVFLTANPFTAQYVAAAMPVQPTIFAANNIWWNDTTSTCGAACFPFTVNVDATMIATFQTNMSASGALPFSGTITGGTTTGWGGYTNAFSFPLANPMQTHLSGLNSTNFKTTASIPYNRTTFAPVGSSPLISAGSQITLTEIAKLPVRWQPLNTGFMSARTDSASSTPTIGAVQTGSLPTLSSVVLNPFPSTLIIPTTSIGQQQNIFCTATYSDGTTESCQYRSQPWASSNNTAVDCFGASNPACNVQAIGTGSISTTFAGTSSSVSFSVQVQPIRTGTGQVSIRGTVNFK